MTIVRRGVALAAVLTVLASAAFAQTSSSVLHIKVVLLDAAQQPTPVPRHALLVSDNPATGLPKRVVTNAEGAADVKLRPGNYTVESERAVAFEGKGYQWMQMLDIVAGRDATLELTSANAEVVTVTPETPSAAAAPLENDPSFLLPQWQDSVVALWTATSRASGFLVDARGLIATGQRAVGEATTAEVQLSPTVKVAARVLLADAVRDVAILSIDPTVVAAARPLPLACASPAPPAVTSDQDVFTIGAPLRGAKALTVGGVTRADPRALTADFRLATGTIGGPVFTPAGVLLGLTSPDDDVDMRGRGDVRIVAVERICGALKNAEQKLADAAPPAGTRLPVEPSRPFPTDVLADATKSAPGSTTPQQLSSSDFDVAFITPPMVHAARARAGRTGGLATGARSPEAEARIGSLLDFGDWSDYFADVPPVLVVRVTPKLVEGFWKMLARGAARTQGIALPPIKSFKPGFLRLRTTCGDTEVTPIHPFVLEQRVSDSDAMREGLYVFDPGALGPHCGTVRLTLYSEKEPGKGDTKNVDAKVLDRIWQDFEIYRQAEPQR